MLFGCTRLYYYIRQSSLKLIIIKSTCYFKGASLMKLAWVLQSFYHNKVNVVDNNFLLTSVEWIGFKTFFSDPKLHLCRNKFFQSSKVNVVQGASDLWQIEDIFLFLPHCSVVIPLQLFCYHCISCCCCKVLLYTLSYWPNLNFPIPIQTNTT